MFHEWFSYSIIRRIWGAIWFGLIRLLNYLGNFWFQTLRDKINFCVADYIICIIHAIISIIYRPAYYGVCCLCLAAGKGQGGSDSEIWFVLIFIKVRFYACFYALFWLDLFVLQEQKQGLRRRMAENSVRLTLSICNIELCWVLVIPFQSKSNNGSLFSVKSQVMQTHIGMKLFFLQEQVPLF